MYVYVCVSVCVRACAFVTDKLCGLVEKQYSVLSITLLSTKYYSTCAFVTDKLCVLVENDFFFVTENLCVGK